MRLWTPGASPELPSRPCAGAPPTARRAEELFQQRGVVPSARSRWRMVPAQASGYWSHLHRPHRTGTHYCDHVACDARLIGANAMVRSRHRSCPRCHSDSQLTNFELCCTDLAHRDPPGAGTCKHHSTCTCQGSRSFGSKNQHPRETYVESARCDEGTLHLGYTTDYVYGVHRCHNNTALRTHR